MSDTEAHTNTLERKDVGTLVDLVDGVDDDNPLDVEIAINESGRVVFFHDKPFKGELSWLEFNTGDCHLNFVMGDGASRQIGMPLAPEISKYMHNTHQILTILMDDKTGEAKKGQYIPLILHHPDN